MAKLEEIIVVEGKRGRGVEGDHYRIVMEYWTKDGVLLAENDPCAPVYDLVSGVFTVEENGQ